MSTTTIIPKLIAVSTILLLSSCGSFTTSGKQKMLDHYAMVSELREFARNNRAARSHEKSGAPSRATSVSARREIIAPLNEPETLIEEPGLAPTGSARPFAADPVEAADLYPEE